MTDFIFEIRTRSNASRGPMRWVAPVRSEEIAAAILFLASRQAAYVPRRASRRRRDDCWQVLVDFGRNHGPFQGPHYRRDRRSQRDWSDNGEVVF